MDGHRIRVPATLETADAVWDVALRRRVPAVALALAAERNYLSSDIGTPKTVLERSAVGRRFNFDYLPRESWWWVPDGHVGSGYAPPPADDWRPEGAYCSAGEPEADFKRRMERLLQWLQARDEQTIALVCHWGVIMALTGESFKNCEVRRVPVEDLGLRDDVAY